MAKSKTKAEATEVAKSATSASVLAENGAHIRTYSLEVHGEGFADLAKEFSEHTPGSSVSLT